MTGLQFVVLAGGVFGCGLAAPTGGTLLTAEGDTAPVAIATFERRVRHTDLLAIEIVFPANADGTPRKDLQNRRWPAVVLVQGSGVDTKRYHWLAAALAQRGYVVALPTHPLELAIFEADNASVARDLLAFAPEGSLLEGLVERERIAIAGHSHGGVVAVKSALSGGYGAVALLGSAPDAADTARFSRTGYPTLLVAGDRDCKASPESIEEASRGGVPGINALAILEGVSHSQFTDDAAQDAGPSCAPELELDVAHERIVNVLTVFLANALLDNGDAGADALAGLEGVEVKKVEGSRE